MPTPRLCSTAARLHPELLRLPAEELDKTGLASAACLLMTASCMVQMCPHSTVCTAQVLGGYISDVCMNCSPTSLAAICAGWLATC